MRIGIDIGGSHIGVGIISEKNVIIVKREHDIVNVENITDMRDYIVDNIKILISQVLKDVGAPSCVISKIGIATPGKVKDNIIYDMYNLGIKEFNLGRILEEYYGVKVTIRNDAKSAALAEKNIGNMQEFDDCVFICLGTGIGGATFINGRMLEYTKDWGSEYGHMVIQKDGLQCKCGNKGCFEKYASMKSFKEGIIKLFDLDKRFDSREILLFLKQKLMQNDIEVKKYIDNYIDNIIIGISNICNILEPEAICLGGSFVYFEEILYNRLIQKIELNNHQYKTPKIVLAKLGNDAGMVGALM